MEKTDAGNMVHVLLVEDSPSDAALLQENLLQGGDRNISINVAKSLREAAGFLRDNHIDAVLLAPHILPGMAEPSGSVLVARA